MGQRKLDGSTKEKSMSGIALTLIVAALSLTLTLSRATHAGIADSPLPVLTTGATTVHLYSVPGVIANGALDTYFSCTSTDTATMQVGIELFGPAGGSPGNDAAATSLSVAPGATVIFGTGAAAGISISSNLGGFMSKGSARILATSKKLACTAFVADPGNAPPTSGWQLTIIKKTTQKAAN
jgi:hypothetical protein